LREPTDLDQLICKAICSFPLPEVRKKLANSIILVGGYMNTKYFVDTLEDQLL
jgi:hypothetical protein